MRPLVSIVVPTYNREAVLCRTLDALLAQTYQPVEIVVVDQTVQHSPATEEYLASVRDRVRVLRLDTPDLSTARNLGIRHSNGEVVLFCDDDVEFAPDTVEKIAVCFATPDVWGVTALSYSANDREADKYLPFMKYVRSMGDFSTKELIAIDSFIGCFMAFRRELFERIGDFDVLMSSSGVSAGEDFDICRRAKLAGYGLYLNPRVTVFHKVIATGGCERRVFAPEVVGSFNRVMYLYSLLKTRSYRGPLGWLASLWQGYRSHVLNRSVLVSKPAKLIRDHMRFARDLRAAYSHLRRPKAQTPDTIGSGSELTTHRATPRGSTDPW